MDRAALLAELNAYQAATTGEEDMRLRLIQFVTGQHQCFSRDLSVGHITASAWVLDRESTHVLLTHHRKLDRWLQLGGHVEAQRAPSEPPWQPEKREPPQRTAPPFCAFGMESETRLIDSALREATEESGLTDVRALRETIFDLDIHTIPARGPEPEHLHYDVRFLLQANRGTPLVVSSESRDLAWVPLDRVQSFNPAESMMRMVRKSPIA